MLSSPLLLLPVRAAPTMASTRDNVTNFLWGRGSPASATGARGHPPRVFVGRDAHSGTRGAARATATGGCPRGPSLVPGGPPDRRGDAVRPPAAAGHPPTGEPSRAPGGRRRAARVRRPCGPAGPTPRRPPAFFFPQPFSRPPAAAGRSEASAALCGGRPDRRGDGPLHPLILVPSS